MRCLAIRERSAARFASLGDALLARAIESHEPCFAATVIRGPAVILGASQRAGRLLDLAACRRDRVTVVRRATSGTAVFVADHTLGFTLALPRINSIAPDATLRTLLNRNVRGFLKGLTRIGATAHYFGRDWIAVQHRPAAHLGSLHTPESAALIEVTVALDATFALPAQLATPLEMRTERFLGKTPIRLRDVLSHALAPADLAERISLGFAARFDLALEPLEEPDYTDAVAIDRDDDPFPTGFCASSAAPCANGFVEAAWREDGAALWLGGDALAPRHVLDAIATHLASGHTEIELEDGAVEGALLTDYRHAADEARRSLTAR